LLSTCEIFTLWLLRLRQLNARNFGGRETPSLGAGPPRIGASSPGPLHDRHQQLEPFVDYLILSRRTTICPKALDEALSIGYCQYDLSISNLAPSFSFLFSIYFLDCASLV
jgi:hypothetical protein